MIFWDKIGSGEMVNMLGEDQSLGNDHQPKQEVGVEMNNHKEELGRS